MTEKRSEAGVNASCLHFKDLEYVSSILMGDQNWTCILKSLVIGSTAYLQDQNPDHLKTSVLEVKAFYGTL